MLSNLRQEHEDLRRAARDSHLIEGFENASNPLKMADDLISMGEGNACAILDQINPIMSALILLILEKYAGAGMGNAKKIIDRALNLEISGLRALHETEKKLADLNTITHPEKEMLDDLIVALLVSHPLPWKIRRQGSSVWIQDADGALFLLGKTDERAQPIIIYAEELAEKSAVRSWQSRQSVMRVLLV